MSAPLSASTRPVIGILSACNFVIGMGAFVIISIIEPLADGLAVSISTAGGLLTAYALSYAVLSPLLVATTGQLGRRRVLFWGLAIFGAASLVAALSNNIWLLYAARVFAAAGAGLVTPVAAAIATALAPPETRGRALAAVFFGITLAQVLGIPAGSWLAYTFGWRAAFFIVALLSLPCLWLVWTRVPQGLRFPPSTLGDLGRVLVDPVKMGAVLFTASFLGAIYVLYTFLAPLLAETMGYGRDGITLVMLIFGVAAVVGNLLGGWMTDRIGSIRTLALLCIAQIVLMPVFSALPFENGTLMGLVFVWSLAGWSFTAAQQLRILSLAPDQAGVLFALNAAAIYVGVALGSALGGAILDRFGLISLGAAAGVAAFGALVHLLASHRAAMIRATRTG
ncbi:MFS transporter [Cognatishimia sp. F0-27]|uniref:MFS transporter n=1 Tax=Cognatishimia sp. F0-27 TaxID=2816855 RepID=UPI001D0C714F|nr:MFS transporter [Cognatishimia sp. F0-27]MCC1491066.1 MFS transporter [Cognatishimia sp. F0-27]